MESHFSAGIIHRKSPPNTRTSGGVEFLVQQYRSFDPKKKEWSRAQIKFPGGDKDKKFPDESPAQTMIREVFEETYLRVERWQEIFEKEVEPDDPADIHIQYGFLIDLKDCGGFIRMKPILDTDGNQLGALYWVGADILVRTLYHTHQEMYLTACRHLLITPKPPVR